MNNVARSRQYQVVIHPGLVGPPRILAVAAPTGEIHKVDQFRDDPGLYLIKGRFNGQMDSGDRSLNATQARVLLLVEVPDHCVLFTIDDLKQFVVDDFVNLVSDWSVVAERMKQHLIEERDAMLKFQHRYIAPLGRVGETVDQLDFLKLHASSTKCPVTFSDSPVFRTSFLNLLPNPLKQEVSRLGAASHAI